MNRLRLLFESIGKIVLTKKGQAILFVLLSIGPCLSLLFLSLRSNDYQEILFAFQKTALTAKKALHNREKKDHFIDRHLKSDSSYISEHLESISLLTKERELLSELCNHPAVADRESLKKRLSSIDKKQNHLSFNEGEILNSKNCLEIIEKLGDPVELSSIDLQHLIHKIEHDVPNGCCPQFTILKFHLTRSKIDGEIRTHLTELELLKREFIKS